MNRIYCFLLLFFYFSTAAFSGPKLGTSAEPLWLTIPDTTGSKLPLSKNINAGYYYSMYEEQVHVELQTAYFRQIINIVTAAGVQFGSEISVSFDPTYEQLVFHKINIIRDGKIINKLDISKFKLIQNEAELSRFIYSGNYTALLLLEDVRKGDKIELSYSCKGRNAIFQNKYHGKFHFEYSGFFSTIHCALIYDKNRHLNFKKFNTVPDPVESVKGNLIVKEWVVKNVIGHSNPELEPSWVNTFPYLQISETKDWEDFTNWAVALNNQSVQTNKEVADKIEALKVQSDNTPLKYMEQATDFVQNEIRYMGVEIGESSHRPNTPAKVINQRFGDCKDKSLLLVTLLKGNGFDAHLAYVNTYLQGHVSECLPSPFNFNHCVVVAFHNAKAYWIDPTISNQKGGMDERYFPNYEKGIIVRKGENSLTEIFPKNPGLIKITEYYTIPDYSGEATLEVKTEYSGHFADAFREQIDAGNISETEKNYLDYYAKQFEKVEQNGELFIEETKDENKVVTIEKYKIKEVWVTTDSATGAISCTLTAQMLRDQLPKLADKARTVPISVKFPYDLDYSIIAKLPGDWSSITKSNVSVSKDAYRFNFKVSSQDSIVTLHYTYKNLQNHIEAQDAGMYLTDINTISENLAYVFSYTPAIANNETRSNGSSILIAAIFTLLFIFLFYHLYKKSLPVSLPLLNNADPIGGWLILILIGLVLTPVKILNGIFTSDYFNAATWLSFESELYADKPLFKYFYMGGLLTSIFLLVFVIFILFLFFNKRNTLPRAIIVFYTTNVIFQLYDYLYAMNYADVLNEPFVKESTTNIFGGMIAFLIWTPYFLRSERVKRTFIYPHFSKMDE